MDIDSLTPEERVKYRRLEYIPGALLWTTYAAAIVLSFVKPLWVIYFIIVFSLYWVLRVFYFVFYSIMAARAYRRAMAVDWEAKVKELPQWRDYYHLITLPTATEPASVLHHTFGGLLAQSFPKDRMMVGVSWEERKKEVYEANEPDIRAAYDEKFFKLLTTLHPDGMEGEIKGKGANAHWLGWRCKEMIDELGISYDKVIVSYFDCDTVVHPQYFWYLTYAYMTHPRPTRSSFQPAVLYSNNIWDAPAPMRIVAFSTVFWLLAELMRPDRLYSFSSHAISFQALVDVGMWQKDIVTDDSRIFLQCFIHYNGDYEVTPMYVPVSMDSVDAHAGLWEGFKSLYKQQRRWAWGVEHFPYMLWHFKKKKQLIPRRTRLKYLWNLGEGFYSWASAPVLMFVLGRLPMAVAGPQDKATVIAQNAPFVLQWLMTIGMIGIFVSAILSIRLLPPRPQHQPRYKYAVMFLQWLLLPITIIAFGSIPSTDAQTRLMLGKYLGFFVTPKNR